MQKLSYLNDNLEEPTAVGTTERETDSEAKEEEATEVEVFR